MSGDLLFACGLVKAREEKLLSRAELLGIADPAASWDEVEQLLERTGFAPDAAGVWRRSPRAWSAQVVAAGAEELAGLLPDQLAPYAFLGIEAHNLGQILSRSRGEDASPGGDLPGGRITPSGVAEGDFPAPWDRDALVWSTLRDRAFDHPLGTPACCRLAAAGYARDLLGASGSEALRDLGERMASGTILGALVRARRQGRPWAGLAPYLHVPASLAGGPFDAVYPLPLEEWGGALADPWGAVLAAGLGKETAVWSAALHDGLAPAIGAAWRETLSAGPPVAWLVQRELHAALAGSLLEARVAGLDPQILASGVPHAFS